MPNKDGTGPFGKGRRGSSGGPLAAGPGGYCVCAGCGYREPHKAGDPCFKKHCPQCGAPLVREN
jgi:hypothetical protein